MAGMILGMITRTALGHTGRPLQAGRGELFMYLLIQVGVIARFAAATAGAADLRPTLLLLAAASWSAAFVLYVAVYAPYLWRARIDGREG
jgi:uncharacterized protein involved in response to NO